MVVLAEACANSTKGQRPLYSLAPPLLTNKSLLFDPLLRVAPFCLDTDFPYLPICLWITHCSQLPHYEAR